MLIYIPMAFIGYHLIRSRRDLDYLLNLMCLTAILPAVVGIAEAILYYMGHTHFVHSLYGPAASTVTQGFAAISVGGADFQRVPSTFSFIAQYYIFMTSMVAIGYAWWRNAPAPIGDPPLALPRLDPVPGCGDDLGERGALAFVPLMLIAILVIEGRLGVSSLGVIAALAAGWP